MTDTELELPQGWVETTVENIGQIVTGNTPSKKDSSNYGNFLPWVKPPQLDSQTPIENTPEKLSKKGASVARVLEKNSILISCIGDLGKLGIAGTQLSTNQQINSVTCFDEIHYKFAYYFFQSSIFSLWLEANNSATVIKIINKGRLSKAPFLLPPRNEQKRIVSKIEELFSKIDSAKQSLEHTKLQLEQYRYSYHHWIFYGDFKEKFGFSSNWEEKPLGKIFKIIGGGTPDTKKSQYWDGDIPWVTSADIHGIKNIVPRRRVSQLGIDNSATHKIPPNSILVVTRVGLGKLAITDEPICINQDIQAVIMDSNVALPLFVLNYLSQTIQIFRFHNQGTTISGVTKKQLSDIPFFLPSLDEQEKIIGHMEMAEARIQNSQSIVNSTLQQLQTMKISVLKQAFEGKLVPQDPNDEPASVLLERIKAK